ncbi:MAG: nucleotidyltransferase domain-containing protein [Candidatus Aenigmarchaeota archaeon]|nr:nucleotidyltransferase domain-containing protein [Candidatus Aenigmarchaeota archaeon]
MVSVSLGGTEVRLIAHVKKEIHERAGGGRLLSLIISGSHLYGFSSEDSDFDIRGIFLIDPHKLLGLSRPKEILEIRNFEDQRYDIVLTEASKEIGLSLNGNCNALEHFNAPAIYSTREYIELKEIINNIFPKAGLYNSYKGMADFNYRKFIAQGRNTVKKYLYVFRGLMAGIYALETGQIEANIEKLNQYFKFKEITELIAAKKASKENDLLPKSIESGVLEDLIGKLHERVDKAYIKSKLAEKVSDKDRDLVEKKLVQMRKVMME